MKKNIAIIGGGWSGEEAVSIRGAKAVEKSLDKDLYNVYVIYIEKHNWYYDLNNDQHIPVDRNDFSLTIDNKKVTFDCVFNVIHGTPGEDGKLQGYFDLLGLKYINSNLTTSAITFNKYFTGILAQHFGANVPKSVLLKLNNAFDNEHIINKLGLPCFVKPNKGGSSVGVSKVTKMEELNAAISKAFTSDDEVLIEEFISGTEISCGMIRFENKTITLPITEIVPKNSYFDYEAKYKEGMSEEITPARISAETTAKCKKISSELYENLNCKGMVRMDYIISNQSHISNLKSPDILYLLDINTVPGLSEASLIPKQAATEGINMKDFYNMVIDEALNS